MIIQRGNLLENMNSKKLIITISKRELIFPEIILRKECAFTIHESNYDEHWGSDRCAGSVIHIFWWGFSRSEAVHSCFVSGWLDILFHTEIKQELSIDRYLMSPFLKRRTINSISRKGEYNVASLQRWLSLRSEFSVFLVSE